MGSTRNLVISFLLAICFFVIGTTGYMIIEGWNLLDAVYMTVITLTTVGYREVHAVSSFGKIYTILLILSGVTFFYMLPVPSFSSWWRGVLEQY